MIGGLLLQAAFEEAQYRVVQAREAIKLLENEMERTKNSSMSRMDLQKKEDELQYWNNVLENKGLEGSSLSIQTKTKR